LTVPSFNVIDRPRVVVVRSAWRLTIQRIDDELFVTEVVEEAGRRIVAHEAEHGQVEDLEAFAWTVVLNVARSRLARSSMRIIDATLDHEASDAVLRALPFSFCG
jgi:hypothetical protein